MDAERPNAYLVALYLSDALATVLSLRLAQLLRQALPFGGPLQEGPGRLDAPVYLMAILTCALVLRKLSAYEPDRVFRFAREIETVLSAVALSALVLSGLLSLLHRGLSTPLFFYFLVAESLLLLTLRLAVRFTFKGLGLRRLAERRLLIVGITEVGRQLAALLREREWMGVRLVGFLDDNAADCGSTVAGLPVLGTLDQARETVERHRIDEVILALPMRSRAGLQRLVAVFDPLPVNVGLVPGGLASAYLNARTTVLADMPLIMVKEPALDRSSLLVKRGLDLGLAILVLACLWPVMLAIAVLIKLDSPGPALFRQRRIGWHGRPFTIFKFRTMRHDADAQVAMMIKRNADGKRYLHKDPRDPRVTRLGRHLRRWSLDELPQLVNVLTGEMSLVGPRPELPEIVEEYGPDERKRLRVPPGMTGWWQVEGRSDRPLALHIEDDLYYIRNYSLFLDLQILLRTLGAVIRGSGAY